MTDMIVSETEVAEIYKTEKFRVHLDREKQAAINELRSKLKEITNLHCPLHDAFLLKFLRAKNNDVLKTVNLVKNYYDLKYDNDRLANIPYSTIASMYDTKFITVLKHRDQLKRKVVYIRFDLVDVNKFSIDEALLSLFFIMEEMILSEETQKNGMVFILDQADLTLTKATQIAARLTVKQVKRMLKVCQGRPNQINPLTDGSFPAKIKLILAINTHFVLSSTYAVFKYLLTEKLRNRTIFTRSGPQFVHKYVHPGILPDILGGPLCLEEAEDNDLLSSTLENEKITRGLQQSYGYIAEY